MHYLMFVDDEEYILRAIRRLLKGSELGEVHTIEVPKEALERLTEREYSVVFSDFLMPGMNGVDFLKEVKLICPAATRVIMTGCPDRLKSDYPKVGEELVHYILNKVNGLMYLRERVKEAIEFYERNKGDLFDD